MKGSFLGGWVEGGWGWRGECEVVAVGGWQLQDIGHRDGRMGDGGDGREGVSEVGVRTNYLLDSRQLWLRVKNGTHLLIHRSHQPNNPPS